MIEKIDKNILRIKTYFYMVKFHFFNYRTAIIYILIILSVLLCTILSPRVINLLQQKGVLPIYNIVDMYSKYYSLYIDTGIGLVGFSALVFSLKTFKQQALNEYMNSVFQKLFDGKVDTYIQYGYLFIIIIIFLFFPNTEIFSIKLSYFIVFYYFSIFSVLFIFGLELAHISNKLSKNSILKEIKKRVIYLYNVGEKIDKNYQKFETKYNYQKHQDLFIIRQMSSIFIVYTQCINLIIKKSFDDPIIFGDGIQTLYDISKVRLEQRKNKFNDYSIPLISETTSLKANDTFIERYLLEYLDDYSKLSLENRNKDNLYIIEMMYKDLLIAGKDNRYINNQQLELTIKIIFIYYLKMIGYIVDFNNENMLFQTINVFKFLFISNRKYFEELVDKNYCDTMSQLSEQALKNKSLMNYRNIQGLITIGLYSVLFSKNEYKEVYLKEIFRTLKISLNLLVKNRNLILEKDGAKIYLDYIFNDICDISISRIYRTFFNSNISKEGKIIDLELSKANNYKCLADFLDDKNVMKNLEILHNSGYFISCDIFVLSMCSLLIETSLKLYILFDNEKNREEYHRLFIKTFDTAIQYIKIFNQNKRIIQSKTDRFYCDIADKILIFKKENETIRNQFLTLYEDALFSNYNNIDDDFQFEHFFKYFLTIYNIFSGNEETTKNYITIFLDRLNDKLNNKIILVRQFISLKDSNSLFSLSNYNPIKHILEEVIQEYILKLLPKYTRQKLNEIYTLLTGKKTNKSESKNQVISKIKDIINKF